MHSISLEARWPFSSLGDDSKHRLAAVHWSAGCLCGNALQIDIERGEASGCVDTRLNEVCRCGLKFGVDFTKLVLREGAVSKSSYQLAEECPKDLLKIYLDSSQAHVRLSCIVLSYSSYSQSKTCNTLLHSLQSCSQLLSIVDVGFRLRPHPPPPIFQNE